jgi:hypothetical protein
VPDTSYPVSLLPWTLAICAKSNIFGREETERAAAQNEAEARRALAPQILGDAVHLIEGWNARQEQRMPMLFSPTIGAAITARYWFLWVRHPACRNTLALTCAGLIDTRRGARAFLDQGKFRRGPHP